MNQQTRDSGIFSQSICWIKQNFITIISYPLCFIHPHDQPFQPFLHWKNSRIRRRTYKENNYYNCLFLIRVPFWLNVPFLGPPFTTDCLCWSITQLSPELHICQYMHLIAGVLSRPNRSVWRAHSYQYSYFLIDCSVKLRLFFGEALACRPWGTNKALLIRLINMHNNLCV
jgi:hypothetical protein